MSTTESKRSYTKRTDEERLQDLIAKVEAQKAKIEEKKRAKRLQSPTYNLLSSLINLANRLDQDELRETRNPTKEEKAQGHTNRILVSVEEPNTAQRKFARTIKTRAQSLILALEEARESQDN